MPTLPSLLARPVVSAPALAAAADAEVGRGAGPSPVGTLRRLLEDGGRRSLTRVLLPLLVTAALLWVVTIRLSSGSAMRLSTFALAWVVMMAAMMLPAAAPVVALYALAADRRAVAPVPAFLTGYLGVWLVSALPAYLLARALTAPMSMGASWVGRLAGTTLVIAAAYELSPWKDRCLRACRSPLTFFLARRGSLRRRGTAALAGGQHGLYCLGCCWALMLVLMAVGGMQLTWAALLTVAISAEKLLPRRTQLSAGIAAATGALGLALLVHPSLLHHLVTTTT